MTIRELKYAISLVFIALEFSIANAIREQLHIVLQRLPLPAGQRKEKLSLLYLADSTVQLTN